jgi:hypothetical protein
MTHTRHIQKRISQRGITTGLVNLVSQFGVEQGDTLITTYALDNFSRKKVGGKHELH